jgi:hypothetical protein
MKMSRRRWLTVLGYLGIFAIGVVILRLGTALSWLDALMGAAVVMSVVPVTAYTRNRHRSG